jgi:hypothetical protein
MNADDDALRDLSRQLYWAQEPGAEAGAGTPQIRERMVEFVAKMRTDERQKIPLGEEHLGSVTPWKGRAKQLLFRSGRFATRRYDRLLGDAMDLNVQLAERVIELERDVDELKRRQGDA